MVNLWGPGAFGAARPSASRPALTPDNGAGDPEDFFRDCSSPEARDGTEIRSGWLNAVLANLRGIVRKSGEPVTNLSDNLLAAAIRSQGANYRAVGGTANDLTVTLDPPIVAYRAGLILRLLTGGAANTGAMTINVDGVGAVALRNNDGSALAGGAVAAASMIEIICDGTNWRVLGLRAATAAEVEAGTINNAAVTPLSLVNRRNPYFIANGSSLFSIPNGVDTKVDNISSLASSFFNSGSGFASSAFTCGAKDAGAWLFIGYAALQMLTASTGGYDYRLSIAKNAATGAFSTCFIAYAGTFGLTVATPYVLAAGDVVDLRAFQNTSTNRNVGATLLFGIRLGNS